jgi:hypothetical protein
MFKNILRGRYGFDVLTYVLLLAAVMFANMKYVWVISLVLVGYALFRTLSKDIAKRSLESQKFNQFIMTEGVKFKKFLLPLWNKGSQFKTRFQQRKDYIFLPCTNCKKTLRLPKNKGKLQVTCPVCGFEFQKKT